MDRSSNRLFELEAKANRPGAFLSSNETYEAIKILLSEVANMKQKPKEYQMAMEEKVQAAKDAVDAVVVEHELVLAEEVKRAEEKGFDEGLKQAGQLGGSDKIYSDAEVQVFLKEKQDEIDALKAQMKLAEDELPGKLEVAKVEAVAAFKLELKAKYEEQQVAETAGETDFLGLLS